MDPEHVKTQFRQGSIRAALGTCGILALSPLPVIAANLFLTEKDPKIWYAVAFVLPPAIVTIGFLYFLFARRCPVCGCRCPIIQKQSGSNCRLCHARLQ